MAQSASVRPTVKPPRAETVAALAAHLLAWAPGLCLLFIPFYSSAGDGANSSATLMEANGAGVLWILLVPLLLTGIAAAAVLFVQRRLYRKTLLWLPAIALLGFCLVAIFSIGAFYLPAALVLLGLALGMFGSGGSGREPAALPDP